jgi:predicted Zn-dependent peptidase
MTQAQPDRLDRIEALLERMAIESERSKRESDERMSRMERRFEENNAAISRDITQLVATQQEALRERQELRQAMIQLADTQEGIARLLGSLDEDRPTILRKLNTIEGKVDSLLQRENHS